MTTVEIRSTPEGLLVNAPRLRRFAALACALGAKPRGDAWLFAREDEKQVRDFWREVLAAVRQAAVASAAKRASEPAPDAEKRAAAFDSSLITLFDPSQSLAAHFQAATNLVHSVDHTAPADQLEEISAALESFAGHLREWAKRRVA